MRFFGFGSKRRKDDDENQTDENKVEESDGDNEVSAEDDQEATTTAQAAAAETDEDGDDVKYPTDETEETDESDKSDKVEETDEADESDDAQDDVEPEVPTELVDEYEGRGEYFGPWDVDDEEGPDYDEYLDLGAFYLPFLQGIELRVKAKKASKQVIGCIITFGSSSLEIEAFAAPKTLGLWDDIREDLLAANPKASEQPGVFGSEILLPVSLSNGKKLTTRVVGVDSPRWMLRGIFSGAAAKPGNKEYDALDGFFSKVVVSRGEEPLAPRDLIPMHPPVTPAQRKAAEEAEASEEPGDNKKKLKHPKGPFNSDQQTEVKSTLSRGPMFSEVR